MHGRQGFTAVVGRSIQSLDVLLFDAARLLSELSQLPPEASAAFALSCAVRAQDFSGLPPDAPILRTVRTALELGAAPVAQSDLGRALQELEDSADLDDDAVASAYYALNTIVSGDPQDAVWAAQRAYDAADAKAQAKLSFDTFSPEIEAALLRDPDVQRELSCQQADLAKLRGRV